MSVSYTFCKLEASEAFVTDRSKRTALEKEKESSIIKGSLRKNPFVQEEHLVFLRAVN